MTLHEIANPRQGRKCSVNTRSKGQHPSPHPRRRAGRAASGAAGDASARRRTSYQSAIERVAQGESGLSIARERKGSRASSSPGMDVPSRRRPVSAGASAYGLAAQGGAGGGSMVGDASYGSETCRAVAGAHLMTADIGTPLVPAKEVALWSHSLLERLGTPSMGSIVQGSSCLLCSPVSPPLSLHLPLHYQVL